MWTALTRFTGTIDGAEKLFNPGDEITAAEANEMGLASKPTLAARVKNGDQAKGA